MGFYQAMYEVMQAKGITAAELSRKTGLRKSYFTELKNATVLFLGLTCENSFSTV